MAAYNKFNAFAADIGLKKDQLNTDTLKICLTNVAPVATNAVFTDITEIAAGNGYTAGGTAISGTAYSQTAGQGKLTAGANVVFTASGGNIGPFRYVVGYDSTASGGPLIFWADYGSSITLTSGASFTVDVTSAGSIFTLQ